MAKNPMQRKAQNSFLLGMLITLLITGIIIAFLVLQLTKMTKEQKEKEANLKSVYIVSQDIASGETVTTEKLQTKTMDITTIPSNALTLTQLEEKTNTYDENGNLIKKAEVISKIDLKKGTIITLDMIANSGELTSDIRKVEYNMLVLPSQLQNGKYIDIRLSLPSGADYIVASHKKIEIPVIDGIDSATTISLNMSENEILMLNGAIVEAYQIAGSKLYATEYVEPGLQTETVANYVPSNTILRLIQTDPNCVKEAKDALFSRIYTNGQMNKESSDNRTIINNALSQNEDKAADNISKKVQEEMQKTKDERQKYLESLGR